MPFAEVVCHPCGTNTSDRATVQKGMAVQRGVNLADTFRSIINGHNDRLGTAASVRSVKAAAITLGGSATLVHESRWVRARCRNHSS